ncbi:hypothetical protein OG562_18330 [Streptomyces sp. NBC_01275]|uniref:hypothetical protein n=1 Tax=Streptomyces sp. NBC_01275 TaxID=2903807 RepID=UPI002256764E|nr:hypothetical protein [Streptomyces sp. NBC_01275]MCX4762897.1 hypothetical protein [Streptomyces sp. NBC_01275]
MVDRDGDVADISAPAWCQRLTAHIADLQSQINRIEKRLAKDGVVDAPDLELIAKAKEHLQAAREALIDSGRLSRFTGTSTDRAQANIHEAEVGILRLVPADELLWKGLPVLVQARLHLHPDDLRLQQLEKGSRLLTEQNRELAVGVLHAAYLAEEAERARVRSFTHIVCAATAAMAVIAAGFALFAFLDPDVGARFCFQQNPDDVHSKLNVCPLGDSPSWQGVWFVEFVGLLAAAVAGAVSLRKVRGTSGPYHVTMSLLLLRLPVGALTAVIGLVLISGRFFPGLTALDTSSQIVAWAVAFGILQEAVTRSVDEQGQLLLDNVRTPGRGSETPEGKKKR